MESQAQIGLVRVSEDSKFVGYYLVDESQLKSLGTYYPFENVKQSITCYSPVRPCQSPQNKGCCCLIFDRFEIVVSCPK